MNRSWFYHLIILRVYRQIICSFLAFLGWINRLPTQGPPIFGENASELHKRSENSEETRRWKEARCENGKSLCRPTNPINIYSGKLWRNEQFRSLKDYLFATALYAELTFKFAVRHIPDFDCWVSIKEVTRSARSWETSALIRSQSSEGCFVVSSRQHEHLQPA